MGLAMIAVVEMRETTMAAQPQHAIQEAFDVRTGEKPRTWYRSDRVFKTKGAWFVRTREGVEIGPYSCRFDAEIDADLLIRQLQSSGSDQARQLIYCQAVAAVNREHQLSTEPYTSYLIEEGGAELLRP